MILKQIDRVTDISAEDFGKNYLNPQIPVVVNNLSHHWPAFEKWNWEYFKQIVGEVEVGVYNNSRAGARIPVNGNDGFMKFGEYLDLICQGPAELRIFLFNIFNYAPQIIEDVHFPDHLTGGFLKKYPMLFVGGAGSVAHMHYDIDMSHIFHTQFAGRKRVLLLHNDQSPFIYKMPATVESAANFVDWHEKLDEQKFPALKYAQAYTTILEHGDTMFMPSGYWHHMQYLDSGFALSLRALPAGILPKLNGLYHLLGKRGVNNMLIRFFPDWWYNYKRKAAETNAQKAMERIGVSA